MSPEREFAPVEAIGDASGHAVLVVGGGIVGLSCALWLQRSGHKVTIVDETPPLPGVDYTRAASYGNAATIALSACLPFASPGIARRVPRMLIDSQSALRIFWRDLPELLPWLLSFLRASSRKEVERIIPVLGQLIRLAEAGHAPLMAESGVPHLKRSIGCMHLFQSEQSFRAAMPDVRRREAEGVRTKLLSVDDIRSREPCLAPLYAGGILFPECYSIDDPLAYATGLGRAFLARGGAFVRGRATGITSRPEGIELAVDGVAQTADRIVIAGGIWSRELARQVGDNVRLQPERGYHVLFPGGEKLLNTPTLYPEDGFYMTPLSEGLRSAGTTELGGLGRPPRPTRCEVIAQKTRRFLPGLGKHEREWLGYRPSMPDSLPVIGPSPRDPRIVYAFGHGHIGLTLAGITGRIVADLVSGRPLPMDISAMRPDRYEGLFG